jgi:hypothetical protein
VDLLAPILDTYMDAAVGLVGCRSTGLQRESCEYDLLVVRPERNPPATLKIGKGFVDLAFSTEDELAAPRSPEIAVSLAFVKPVRDNSLVLSTCSSTAREAASRNFQKSAEDRLASSVKSMGRAEEAISKGAEADSAYWLVSAGYDFAYAWLLSSQMIPAPSHLLAQLRQLSRRQPGMFEAFSNSAGLQGASRAACEARLDSLGVIYDLLETPGTEPESASPETVRASYELLGIKSTAIIQASQPADAYCFLGREVVRTLPEVLASRLGRRETYEMVSSLAGGEVGLLAQSVVKSLGITRSPDAIQRGLDTLRNQVSVLSRKT